MLFQILLLSFAISLAHATEGEKNCPPIENESTYCKGEPIHRHPNGCGIIGNSVQVKDMVHIDDKSLICGKLKIVNSGPITNSKIFANGIIWNPGKISNSEIRGFIFIKGASSDEVTISDAKIIGPESADPNDKTDWIRISGLSKISGHIEGSDITITSGLNSNHLTEIKPTAKIRGKHIIIQGKTIEAQVNSCSLYVDSGERLNPQHCENKADSADQGAITLPGAR